MSNHEPIITEHEPWFQPYIPPAELERERSEHKRNVALASREQCARDASLIAALNHEAGVGRPTQPPPLRCPKLSFDAAALDETIYRRGVAFDRARLLSLGKQRFKDLLAADHEARKVQRLMVDDITDWSDTLYSFQAAGQRLHIKPRSNSEILAGRGKDREEAARLDDFSDLWKLQSGEVELVRRLYAFHDLLEALVFAQSVLERIDSEGRVRSRFEGHGALFKQWLPALAGAHFVVKLGHEPLFNVLAWLTGEQTACPAVIDLARQWYGCRAPTDAQLALSQAVLQGFLEDRRSWELWEHVGTITRQYLEQERLEDWRKDLQKRFKRVAAFHSDLRQYFYRPVGGSGGLYGSGPHFEFDGLRHRRYLDKELGMLVNYASLVAGKAIEIAQPGTVTAMFPDWLLCQGKPKPGVIDTLQEHLGKVFGATFNVALQEEL